MRHYYRIVLNIIFLIVSLGFIGPWLISQKDDILAITGAIYILLAVPTILYMFNKNYIIGLINKAIERIS